MKISIIIPVYNVERYLRRCVDSILNQTFTDFECILVDDGSPDKCPQICDEYAQKDKRIKVIHKRNGGLSDARNAGIDVAQGEYIVFVDSDDWIHPQTLEIVYFTAKKTGADMVSFGYRKVYDEPKQFNCYDIDEEIGKFHTYEREYILDNLYNKMRNEINVEACKKLYKKELFERIKFKKGIIHEDDDIFLDLLFSINKVAVSQILLYYYFMSPNSIMRSGFSEKEFIRLEIDMRNIVRINKEKILSQKKLCSIPYLQHFMEFSYLIDEEYQELKTSFEKYKRDYIKNILYMFVNRNLSKAFAFLAILFYISPKFARKYYNKLLL